MRFKTIIETKNFLLNELKDKNICYHIFAGEDFSPLTFFHPSSTDLGLESYPNIFLFVDMCTYEMIPKCKPFLAQAQWNDDNYSCKITSCELIGKLNIPKPLESNIDRNYNNVYMLKTEVYEDNTFVYSPTIIYVVAEMLLFQAKFLVKNNILLHSSFAARAMDYTPDLNKQFITDLHALNTKYILTNTFILSKGYEFDFFPKIVTDNSGFILFENKESSLSLEFLNCEFGNNAFIAALGNTYYLLDFGAPYSYFNKNDECVINHKKVLGSSWPPVRAHLENFRRFEYPFSINDFKINGVIGADLIQEGIIIIKKEYCIFGKQQIFSMPPICTLSVKYVTSGLNNSAKFLVLKDVQLGNIEESKGDYLLDSGFAHSYIGKNVVKTLLNSKFPIVKEDYDYANDEKFSYNYFKVKLLIQGFNKNFDFGCPLSKNMKKSLKKLKKYNNINGIINIFDLMKFFEADSLTYVNGSLSFYKTES